MRGHVRKRGKTWSFVVELPRREDGRRHQKWENSFPTRKDAEAALTVAKARLQSGTYVLPSKQSVAEYLLDDWLPAIRSTVRPSTFESYQRNVRVHIIPALGQVRLSALDASHLNRLYAQLSVNGKRRGPGGGLSPRSIHYIHTILHRALRDAVKWDRVVRNAADLADPPRGRSAPSKVTAWDAESLTAFLVGARDDRLLALWVLLATTGMRRGEALGLRWSDVDLSACTLAVRQTLIAVDYKLVFSEPKTGRGRRVVVLDDGTVAALKAHKSRQAQEKLAQGQEYRDSGLIFTRIDGQPLHPDHVSKMFKRRAHQLGLPVLSLHGLRHTWATLALREGIHPKIVSERLGHADIMITLNTYSHVTPTMQADAARTVARLVLGESAG